MNVDTLRVVGDRLRSAVAAVGFVGAGVLLCCSAPNKGTGACEQGGCSEACDGGSSGYTAQACQLTCTGGSCSQACTGNDGSCDLACDGGGRQQSCSGDCKLSCNGGNCRQDCEGGPCVVTCAGGGCTCVGRDCPEVPVCPSIALPHCCQSLDLKCRSDGRSCFYYEDGNPGRQCCNDDHGCQAGASCWLYPLAVLPNAPPVGVCLSKAEARCCLDQKAYSCTTSAAYARCAGYDVTTCRAQCAPDDCSCQMACDAQAAAAPPGGDPSLCTRTPVQDALCAAATCAGQWDGTACRCDTDCASGNCQGGKCYGRGVGNPCSVASQCDSGNCFGYCCAANALGSPCVRDSDCASRNCAGGLEQCCDFLFCIGTCAARTAGSPCGVDSECDSARCGGACCGCDASSGPGQCR